VDLDREGCRDLVLAVFRLAVCDYLGQRYGHDGPVSNQRLSCTNTSSRSAAATFLTGGWAENIASLAGFTAFSVWSEATLRASR
jgi:hypothetical protein